ncbi:hypothetical protein CYMTET_48700 [Cymbomonas tetramitiformis]|uniref:CCHC-type domain-containing protein n=1 Tax=Cymbomonas tetramitiformis TaxID=36881 RepID=A0AAE0BT00_9CHLO|nr:hypothetical protein CYMTET_48700 [Cymbomonas tetramitiformis]
MSASGRDFSHTGHGNNSRLLPERGVPGGLEPGSTGLLSWSGDVSEDGVNSQRERSERQLSRAAKGTSDSSSSDREFLWQDTRRGLKRLVGRDHPVSRVVWFQLDDYGLSATGAYRLELHQKSISEAKELFQHECAITRTTPWKGVSSPPLLSTSTSKPGEIVGRGVSIQDVRKAVLTAVKVSGSTRKSHRGSMKSRKEPSGSTVSGRNWANRFALLSSSEEEEPRVAPKPRSREPGPSSRTRREPQRDRKPGRAPASSPGHPSSGEASSSSSEVARERRELQELKAALQKEFRAREAAAEALMEKLSQQHTSGKPAEQLAAETLEAARRLAIDESVAQQLAADERRAEDRRLAEVQLEERLQAVIESQIQKLALVQTSPLGSTESDARGPAAELSGPASEMPTSRPGQELVEPASVVTCDVENRGIPSSPEGSPLGVAVQLPHTWDFVSLPVQVCAAIRERVVAHGKEGVEAQFMFYDVARKYRSVGQVYGRALSMVFRWCRHLSQLRVPRKRKGDWSLGRTSLQGCPGVLDCPEQVREEMGALEVLESPEAREETGVPEGPEALEETGVPEGPEALEEAGVLEGPEAQVGMGVPEGLKAREGPVDEQHALKEALRIMIEKTVDRYHEEVEGSSHVFGPLLRFVRQVREVRELEPKDTTPRYCLRVGKTASEGRHKLLTWAIESEQELRQSQDKTSRSIQLLAQHVDVTEELLVMAASTSTPTPTGQRLGSPEYEGCRLCKSMDHYARDCPQAPSCATSQGVGQVSSGGYRSTNWRRSNDGGGFGSHWVGFCPGGRFPARSILPAVRGASPVTAGSGGQEGPTPAASAIQVLRDRWRRCRKHLGNNARRHLRNRDQTVEYEEEDLDMLAATRTTKPEPPEREQVERRIQREQADFQKAARAPVTTSVQRSEEPWGLLCWITGVGYYRGSRALEVQSAAFAYQRQEGLQGSEAGCTPLRPAIRALESRDGLSEPGETEELSLPSGESPETQSAMADQE